MFLREDARPGFSVEVKEHSGTYFPSAKVQIRPWNLSDSDFVMDGSQPLDPRKTIFVGGVPRPLRAGNPLIYTCTCVPTLTG